MKFVSAKQRAWAHATGMGKGTVKVGNGAAKMIFKPIKATNKPVISSFKSSIKSNFKPLSIKK